MDDDDRDSNASSDNDRDEVMEDVEEAENDNPEEEENEDEAEEEEDAEQEQPGRGPRSRRGPAPATAPATSSVSGLGTGPSQEGGRGNERGAGDQENDGGAPANPTISRTSATPGRTSATPQPLPRLRPRVRPEAVTAKLYDIVPTMAAPQSTSINAISITPDLRYWMTGGSDGYIRKYDGAGTINGKQLLTVAQRHPFVDSVVKAGILMSYWENEEPTAPTPRGAEEQHSLSPVYSLAVHSQALWLLSGTEGGGINLQSVRHDEGKRITCLQRHSNAVSVLQLAPDEKSVLSGSWDKNIFDWDLNSGQIMRQYDGSGGQISALELRPASGAPIPQDSYGEPGGSSTFLGSNGRPLPNGVPVNGMNGVLNGGSSATVNGDDGLGDAQESPAHESLFGSTAGSLFGDNDAAGGNPFGDDNENDNAFSQAMEMTLQGGSAAQGGNAQQPGGGAAAAPGSALAPDIGQQQQQRPAGGPSLQGISGHLSGLPNGEEDGAMANGGSGAAGGGSAEGGSTDQQQQDSTQASLPNLVFSSEPAPMRVDPSQCSETTFFSASIDGAIRIWDRRVNMPIARINNRPGVPPWCMGACWSPDGNWIYAGRRNGTVEEYNIHKAKSGWQPERALKLPPGSGPVSAVRAMANGRHLVCASHDILRLYDLQDPATFKHSSVPFLIIPGPPKAGVISHLYIDPSSRFMISAAGTRGWEGTSTEVLIGYEINVAK